MLLAGSVGPSLWAVVEDDDDIASVCVDGDLRSAHLSFLSPTFSEPYLRCQKLKILSKSVANCVSALTATSNHFVGRRFPKSRSYHQSVSWVVEVNSGKSDPICQW